MALYVNAIATNPVFPSNETMADVAVFTDPPEPTTVVTPEAEVPFVNLRDVRPSLLVTVNIKLDGGCAPLPVCVVTRAAFREAKVAWPVSNVTTVLTGAPL